ncbi:hypothetical protein lerEdw1_021104 [Lerista edwardsae]|nr:hypothetical protein lerEdw1_021105 [Lerista edwardsae]KAJ6651299.1 hypothetical protein lerEdw1_021104 [Lerista edwardsae]
MARAANRQAGYRVATSSAKTGQSEKGKEAGKWKPLVASVNNNNNPWTRDCFFFLVLETMPFLGQDWRSPGWRWIKTADGWKRCEPCSSELDDEKNQLNNIGHTV